MKMEQEDGKIRWKKKMDKFCRLDGKMIKEDEKEDEKEDGRKEDGKEI